GTQFSRNLHARHGTPDTAGRAGVVCRAPARAPGRTMAAYRALERFRRCRLSRLLELRPTRSGVESHPIWLRLAMGPHNLEGRAKASRWTARRRVCPYRASSPAITIEPADETLPEDHGRPGAGIPGITARGAGAAPIADATELVGALDDQQGQVRRDLNRKIIELASSLAGQELGEYSQSDHRQHGRGGVAPG